MPASSRSWPRRPELLLLTACAALTRFWGLFSPHAVVFDEVHYEKYVADYLARVFYVDVHPPLANQIFALAAKLFGVPIATLAGPHPAPVLRVVPALAGTLIIPVFYVLLRRLGASRRLATLGGALLLLDNALLVESRVLVPDSMLVLFGLSAVTVFLGARRCTGRARLWRLAATAALAGLAVTMKWTGLSALGLIGVIWLYDAWRARGGWRRTVWEGAVLVAIPVAIYTSVFAVHFAWMDRSGPGNMFMSGPFKATLIGSPNYRADARLSFADKFLELNVAMRQEDAALVGVSNSSASPWYSWPLIQHAITFWAGPVLPDGRRATIFLEGNPVVWYGIPVALLLGGIGLALRRARARAWREPLIILGAAYLFNFLPFMLIHRLMYQYSYFMAFVYSLGLAVIAVGAWAGELEPRVAPPDGAATAAGGWRFPRGPRAAIYYGILIAALAGFVWFAPVTYGWPLSPQAFRARFALVERHF